MKINAEKFLKWGIAIVVIFGTIGVLFRLELITPLFVILIISSFTLVLLILLQAGKGGGLAAIGGLSDQTAFGTKTGTLLSKVTYLVGAAFIVSTVCLTKIYTTKVTIVMPPISEAPMSAHDFMHAEEEAAAGAAEETSEGEVPVEVPVGMKTVQEADVPATPPANEGTEEPGSAQESE